ncbi:hypothetical protein ACWD3I_28685 [Streptomyces sp. NPDC002817]
MRISPLTSTLIAAAALLASPGPAAAAPAPTGLRPVAALSAWGYLPRP